MNGIGTTGYPFGKNNDTVGFLPQNFHPNKFLTDQRVEGKKLTH